MGHLLSRFTLGTTLAAVLAISSPANTTLWLIDPQHTAAGFSVKHLMISTVRGQFKSVTGTVVWDDQDISKSTVDVTIDANTVDTSEPKRDADLKSASPACVVGMDIVDNLMPGVDPVGREIRWNNFPCTVIGVGKKEGSSLGTSLDNWIILPLTAYRKDFGSQTDSLRVTARAHDADFAIGLVNYEPATGRYFNGLLVMNEDGDGWYYKRHLVPFGEYFPVPGFVRSWMRLMSLPYDDISAGSEHQPALRAAGQGLGLTICYEDAFGSSQLDVLRDATLLINVTNNAWYRDSTAPHQHLQIARMRALEAGRFLICAANDGITAVIGRELSCRLRSRWLR